MVSSTVTGNVEYAIVVLPVSGLAQVEGTWQAFINVKPFKNLLDH